MLNYKLFVFLLGIRNLFYFKKSIFAWLTNYIIRIMSKNRFSKLSDVSIISKSINLDLWNNHINSIICLLFLIMYSYYVIGKIQCLFTMPIL